MIRRPTPKAGIIAGIGGLLVVVGTTAQAGWLFVLAAGVLGLVASGLIVSHRLAGAQPTRVVPARTRVGRSVSIELRLRNTSRGRLPVMRVEDRFAAFEEISVAAESVPAGGTVSVEVEREAVARGVFDEGEILLVTSAPFGLLQSHRAVRVKSRLIVHPAWKQLRSFALPETAAATADEALAVARSGHGEVFAGVRDYRPGDQRRWVHWRTTARTGRLVVREHEDPARSPVVLLVAEDRDGPARESAIADAASVGCYALDNGRPVHCVGAGVYGDYVEDATKLQVLDWCAGLGPALVSPEDAVAASLRRWGRLCSFVLFGDGDSVAGAARLARSRGAGVVVVESDAETGT